MEIIIKHPTNSKIDFIVKMEDSLATQTTIEQLLKYIEIGFIKINRTNINTEYSKYWNLMNHKTGKILEKKTLCCTIYPENNKFSISWDGK